MIAVEEAESMSARGSELDRDFLRRFIELDRAGAFLGALFVVVVNGVFVANKVVWGIVPVLLMLVVALTAAIGLCDRGETIRPLILVAIGNWVVAIVIPLFLPALWPVMVVTVLAPVVLAAPYLDQDRIGLVLGVMGVVTGLVAALGLLNDDGGALPDLADELELLIVIGSLVAQILPIGFIAWHNNRRQNQQLNSLRRLNESLQASQADLLTSRRRVVEAADNERRRIERDLHDGAQQRLVALSMRLRLLHHDLGDERNDKRNGVDGAEGSVGGGGGGEGETASSVAMLSTELDEAIAEIRELAHGIYPTLLQSQGLAAALRPVVRRVSPQVRFLADDVDTLDPATSAALYFTALEALANVAKHAPDDNVLVSLGVDGSDIVLSIADDGPGFDPAISRTSNGVQNMQDRVAAVGGLLLITSSPGQGCQIEARVPGPTPIPIESD